MRRTGPLFQTGNGPLTFDVAGNQDQNFGGCPTSARTGLITTTEQSTNREARLDVVQQGSPGPFRAPTACVVTAIPYGTTVSGSITTSDCAPSSGSSARAKYYTFQGLTDQQVLIRMFGGRFVSGGLASPRFTLYGPGGGFILRAGGNVVTDDPRATRNLFCGGTYTLEVSSSIDATFNPTGLGNYTVRLDSQN